MTTRTSLLAVAMLAGLQGNAIAQGTSTPPAIVRTVNRMNWITRRRFLCVVLFSSRRCLQVDELNADISNDYKVIEVVQLNKKSVITRHQMKQNIIQLVNKMNITELEGWENVDFTDISTAVYRLDVFELTALLNLLLLKYEGKPIQNINHSQAEVESGADERNSAEEQEEQAEIEPAGALKEEAETADIEPEGPPEEEARPAEIEPEVSLEEHDEPVYIDPLEIIERYKDGDTTDRSISESDPRFDDSLWRKIIPTFLKDKSRHGIRIISNRSIPKFRIYITRQPVAKSLKSEL